MYIERVFDKLRLLRFQKKLGSSGKNLQLSKNTVLVNPDHIHVGENFEAGHSLQLQVWTKYRGKEVNENALIEIGNNVSIMSNCHISSANHIIIGNGVLIGDNVFITDNFHGESCKSELPPIERKLYSKGPVIVGDNVWIGRNVCIMPNVKIGNNSIIGANSIVTKDVEENSIYAGNPAKLIKKL